LFALPAAKLNIIVSTVFCRIDVARMPLAMLYFCITFAIGVLCFNNEQILPVQFPAGSGWPI